MEYENYITREKTIPYVLMSYRKEKSIDLSRQMVNKTIFNVFYSLRNDIDHVNFTNNKMTKTSVLLGKKYDEACC